MPTVKVLELMGESNKSWEDAVNEVVKDASQSVKDIRSLYVQDMSVSVKDGKVDKFRVSCKLSFGVKGT